MSAAPSPARAMPAAAPPPPRSWEDDSSYIMLYRNRTHDRNRMTSTYSEVVLAEHFVGAIQFARVKANLAARKKLGRDLTPDELMKVEAEILIEDCHRWDYNSSDRTTLETFQRLTEGIGMFHRRETKRGSGVWKVSMDERTWPAMPDYAPLKKPPVSSQSIDSENTSAETEGRRNGEVDRAPAQSNGRSRAKFRFVKEPVRLEPGQPSPRMVPPPEAPQHIEGFQFASDAPVDVDPVLQNGFVTCKIHVARVVCINCRTSVEMNGAQAGRALDREEDDHWRRELNSLFPYMPHAIDDSMLRQVRAAAGVATLQQCLSGLRPKAEGRKLTSWGGVLDKVGEIGRAQADKHRTAVSNDTGSRREESFADKLEDARNLKRWLQEFPKHDSAARVRADWDAIDPKIRELVMAEPEFARAKT